MLTVVAREAEEKQPREIRSRNTSVSRINDDYITQASEEIEGLVTKKLFHQFNSTESRISGAVYKLDEFLLNLQVRKQSLTVLETSRKTGVETTNQMRIVLRLILVLK